MDYQTPQPAALAPPPQMPGPDRSDQKDKSLYSASWASIFFRNFLAGAAKALGGIIMYILFLYLIARVVSTYVLPQITPLIDTLQTLVQLQSQQQNQLQAPGAGAIQVTPEQIDQAIKQLQQNQN